MIKAVAMDFDGVILESIDIKTRAFAALFQDVPQHLDRIIRLHKENTGLSRYDKFSIIYRDLLKIPLSQSEMWRLGERFSHLVSEEMLSCLFVPGALEFLEQQSRLVPIFIVSATPEEELRCIVSARKLDGFCRGIRGAPPSKDILLRQILGQLGLRATEALFIGDSLSDFTAASSVGMHFVGRVRSGETNPFPESVRYIVGDLRDLAARWSHIVAGLC